MLHLIHGHETATIQNKAFIYKQAITETANLRQSRGRHPAL